VGAPQFSHGNPGLYSLTENPGVLHSGQGVFIFAINLNIRTKYLTKNDVC
jgi:hypothetical protein